MRASLPLLPAAFAIMTSTRRSFADDYSFADPRLREAELLVDLIRLSRLTLLYGETGAARTDMLRSGVMPLLDAASKSGKAEVAVFFDAWDREPLSALRNTIHERIHEAVLSRAPMQGPGRDIGASSPADSLAAWQEALGVTFFIILDHFEKHLAASPDRDGVGEFDAAFVAMVNAPSLRANFLLSVEEDAEPLLKRFRARIPGMGDACVRLSRQKSRSSAPVPVCTDGAPPVRTAMVHAMPRPGGGALAESAPEPSTLAQNLNPSFRMPDQRASAALDSKRAISTGTTAAETSEGLAERPAPLQIAEATAPENAARDVPRPKRLRFASFGGALGVVILLTLFASLALHPRPTPTPVSVRPVTRPIIPAPWLEERTTGAAPSESTTPTATRRESEAASTELAHTEGEPTPNGRGAQAADAVSDRLATPSGVPARVANEEVPAPRRNDSAESEGAPGRKSLEPDVADTRAEPIGRERVGQALNSSHERLAVWARAPTQNRDKKAPTSMRNNGIAGDAGNPTALREPPRDTSVAARTLEPYASSATENSQEKIAAMRSILGLSSNPATTVEPLRSSAVKVVRLRRADDPTVGRGPPRRDGNERRRRRAEHDRSMSSGPKEVR